VWSITLRRLVLSSTRVFGGEWTGEGWLLLRIMSVFVHGVHGHLFTLSRTLRCLSAAPLVPLCGAHCCRGSDGGFLAESIGWQLL
jgi:hypothetical protein